VILVDTSAWIEFDRGTGGSTHHRLRNLISTRSAIAVTEPVLMELLAGARDDRSWERLRSLLLSFHLIPVDPAADFEAAARVYRRCRRNGVTPRGLLDCMIVAVAWRTGAYVLTADSDLLRIAAVMGVTADA
jgi:predicted nucleic acid-binding protein